jgi:hypothetical protein
MRYLEAAVHSARAAWPGPRDHGSHGIGNRVPYGMRLHDVKVKMCADRGTDSTCNWHQLEDTARFLGGDISGLHAPAGSMRH